MSSNDDLLRSILTAARYERMPLDAITPAPYNPRVDLTPDDPEYQAIKDSIIHNDMLEPIIYNERTGNAVGGNQRLKILLDLGVKEATCAIVNMSLPDEMQACVALNRLDNMWDQTKLRDVMLILKEAGIDPATTAFTQREIDKITEDMSGAVADFFVEQEAAAKRAKAVRTYRCPHCGEVFSK